MFTEKEITDYRSIKAPDELLWKIKRKQRMSYFPVRAMAVAAAAFIFILSGFYFYSQRESDIIVSGQELKESIVFYDTATAMEREASVGVSFPIEIHPARSTRVFVSKGEISLDGTSYGKEITVSKDSTIWWEIEPEENGIFEMSLSDKKGVEKVILKYEEGKITVTKEKK